MSRLILWITWSLVKYKLMKKIIKEFKERGIFEKHRDYIKAWLSYLAEKEFSEELEKRMLTEIKRYLSTRDEKDLDHIVEVVWNDTGTEAWIIVIEEQKN